MVFNNKLQKLKNIFIKCPGKVKHIAEWKMTVDGAIRYFFTMLARNKCKNYHIKFFKNFMAPFYGWGSTA